MRLSATLLALLTVAASPVLAVDSDRDRDRDRDSVGSSRGTVRAAPLRSTITGELYDINDLRLNAGFLPEHTTANGNGYNWDHNYRLGLLGMRAPKALGEAGGLIYGGEVSFNTGSKAVPGNETSATTLMFDGMVGWAYRLDAYPAIHFEGTPFLGIGMGRYSDDIGGSTTEFTYEYGLRAAAYYTFENMWQAGLDLRYMQTIAEPQFGGGIGGVDLKTTGLAILASGGKRF